jgi:hypothetical protein
MLPDLAATFFRVSATTFPKIAQPILKPSLFRPIPVLGDEAISVIEATVDFALTENKLPGTHNRSPVKVCMSLCDFFNSSFR